MDALWVSDLCLSGLTDIWFTSPSYGVTMSSREPSSPRPPHSVLIHIFVISSSLLSSLSPFYEQKEKKRMNMPKERHIWVKDISIKPWPHLPLRSPGFHWWFLSFQCSSLPPCNKHLCQFLWPMNAHLISLLHKTCLIMSSQSKQPEIQVCFSCLISNLQFYYLKYE